MKISVDYLSIKKKMPHVPALEASTLLLVEPGLNPVWAYLAHGERPRPLAWIGGAVIVLSALAKTRWDARHGPAPTPGSAAPAAGTTAA